MNKYIQIQGDLFEAVQRGNIFPDSKTFVDSCPSGDPEDILKNFRNEKNKSDFHLKSFIENNFILPGTEEKEVKIHGNPSMEEHILNLWDELKREPDKNCSPFGTLIPLPHPYVVPGGRFREIYYWDSYFTSEGLAASGKLDMVENMIKNFAFMIDEFGHIPNGNRIYYLSRSQPPFFCSMVEILAQYKGAESVLPYLPHLEKEYSFWMKGKKDLTAENPANLRSVLLEDGSVLNRYWDDEETPREESYREDAGLYKSVNAEKQKNLYRNIRAACESGWDFSSRWFEDDKLDTIRTTEIIPVDLNSLLYNMETKLSDWFSFKGDKDKSEKYNVAAEKRKKAIHKYFWDEEEGFFFDYCRRCKSGTSVWSLAGVYPLFFRIATEEEAEKTAKVISEKFLFGGGLVTTLRETGQQWDKPNGWAPLQWIAIRGLEQYGHKELAKEIAKRFINLTGKVFEKTGRMMEKYDVCDMSLEAGGGEYPLQDGFGWTNGVVIALMKSLAPFMIK